MKKKTKRTSRLSLRVWQGEKIACIAGDGSEIALEVYQPRIYVKFTRVPSHVIKFYRIYIFQKKLFEVLVLF